MASALYCFIVLPRNSIVRKNTIAANPVVGRVSFSVSEVSLLKPEVSLLKPEGVLTQTCRWVYSNRR